MVLAATPISHLRVMSQVARPPNNWVSYFGGPGWQWEPRREQFYYHTFLVQQPEMDWRTPIAR